MTARFKTYRDHTRAALVVCGLFVTAPAAIAGAPTYGTEHVRLPATLHHALKQNGWRVISQWPGLKPINSDAFESRVEPWTDPTNSGVPQGLSSQYRRWVATGDARDTNGAHND